jgi:hypothetical protein
MNETVTRIYHLRADLGAAEAELTQASTDVERSQCLARYEQALDRYSDLVLRPVADVSSVTKVLSHS